jgi:hypothetical protein
MVYKSPNGDRYLDYTHFNEALPLEPAYQSLTLLEQQTG